jgi:hypothetical protein
LGTCNTNADTIVDTHRQGIYIYIYTYTGPTLVFSNSLETWILFLQDSSHLFTNHPLCLTFFYDIVVTLIWKHGKLLSVCCWHVIFFRVHLSLGSQTPMWLQFNSWLWKLAFIECIKEKNLNFFFLSITIFCFIE